MWRVIEFLSRQSRTFLLSLGIVMVLVVAVIRYATGPEFALSLFFMLPIFLVAWFVGKPAGIILSVLSALAWLAADVLMGRNFTYSFSPYLNGIFRLSVFLILVNIVAALKTNLERERTFARKDFLTGIANRQAFFEYAGIEINRCRRYGYPVTIAYLDCDNLKSINDNQGHQTGDSVLKAAADTLQKSIRATDIVARLGGDEFSVLLPETGQEAAGTVILKVQRNLLDVMKKNQWPATFSFGVVTFNRPPLHVDELINRADAEMYGAKQEGKNTIRQAVVEE
ncbi:MAG: diguanylate cyclase [Nitrospirota bacterium]